MSFGGRKAGSPVFGDLEGEMKGSDVDEDQGSFFPNPNVKLEVDDDEEVPLVDLEEFLEGLEETAENLEGIVDLEGEESEIENEADLKEQLKKANEMITHLTDQLEKVTGEKEDLAKENGKLNQSLRVYMKKVKELRETISLIMSHEMGAGGKKLPPNGMKTEGNQKAVPRPEGIKGMVSKGKEVRRGTNGQGMTPRMAFTSLKTPGVKCGPGKPAVAGPSGISAKRPLIISSKSGPSAGTTVDRAVASTSGSSGQKNQRAPIKPASSSLAVAAVGRGPLSSQKPKKFHCDICNRNFNTLSVLKLHKQKHHGIPDLGFNIGCTICGITFSSRKEHTKHRITVHGTKLGRKSRKTESAAKVTAGSKSTGSTGYPGSGVPKMNPRTLRAPSKRAVASVEDG